MPSFAAEGLVGGVAEEEEGGVAAAEAGQSLRIKWPNWLRISFDSAIFCWMLMSLNKNICSFVGLCFLRLFHIALRLPYNFVTITIWRIRSICTAAVRHSQEMVKPYSSRNVTDHVLYKSTVFGRKASLLSFNLTFCHPSWCMYTCQSINCFFCVANACSFLAVHMRQFQSCIHVNIPAAAAGRVRTQVGQTSVRHMSFSSYIRWLYTPLFHFMGRQSVEYYQIQNDIIS